MNDDIQELTDRATRNAKRANIAAAVAVVLAIITLALTLLPGCGSDPHPPTGSACFDDQDIAQNCYTCASTPACHWCASTDATRRGCYPRTDPLDCGGEVVRISDLCNDLGEGLDR